MLLSLLRTGRSGTLEIRDSHLDNLFHNSLSLCLAELASEWRVLPEAIGPTEFRIRDVRRALPGVSDPTIRLVLTALRGEDRLEVTGVGAGAKWRRIDSPATADHQR